MPKCAATDAPIAAPIGRAPKVAVMIKAETRPSIALGVTACLNVIVEIVQMIGPTPNRKKLAPTSWMEGTQRVASITLAAQRPANGPSRINVPNETRRAMQGTGVIAHSDDLDAHVA